MTAPSNSVEMLKAFASRAAVLIERRMQLTEDFAALKTEVNSAGFRYADLKRVETARIAAENGKPKALRELRESTGELQVYLDVLAPQTQTQEAAE